MAEGTLIDTRLLGKPKTYSGNKDEFPTFKYQLLNYIGAINIEFSNTSPNGAYA